MAIRYVETPPKPREPKAAAEPSTAAKPPVLSRAPKGTFDRKAYMREYMRQRRKKD